MSGGSSFRASDTPSRVDAIEVGTSRRPGAVRALLGQNLKLDTRGLTSYFFSCFDRRLFDLLVVAAAVEFCDRLKKRPALGWSRSFDLRIAVHEPQVWTAPEVKSSLQEALAFLTGDLWNLHFSARRSVEPEPASAQLPLPTARAVVMPYSEGLDSLAVHALTADMLGKAIVRVRLGPGGVDRQALDKDQMPFARVPYRVSVPSSVESSSRARGFKFAAVTAIAAALSKVSRIIVTESGQGALGPVLVRSGHAYPDYRVHPAFSRKMEHFFFKLTRHQVRYDYPRLWSTKGETLAAARALQTPPEFSAGTRSCWQSSQHASVDGRRRQCGICAACMLRRMSMMRAGISEPPDTYVWENLGTEDFDAGAATSFTGHTSALREYGIAGVLHLDHLAAMGSQPAYDAAVSRVARLTADALGDDEIDIQKKMRDLLLRHADEWQHFVAAQGSRSFVARYAVNAGVS